MKIKKLAIRNIASIEEADIDFTKDLVDVVTGDPASIFLISGDTGVGKSVILDSIALALYGKTPRLESVENSQSNKFTDTRGEEVKVKSVEQYTRLGISEKDPCFCEVVYEGNDGREYCSRLTLGYKLGNDKVLRNRAYSMSLTVGTDQYGNKDEVKKLNEAAIGLTFKQFNRMVMLAQGQFAAFLTGKKEERQEILEQLTNTEHFSAYGAAIERLFKQAKTDYETKKGHWEQAKEYVLADEIVASLKRELAEVKEKERQNSEAARVVGVKIDAVKKIVAAADMILQTSKKKTELEAVMGGSEYLEAQAAIKDWDDTVTERQRLQDIRNERRDLEDARKGAVELAGQFAILLADLAFRNEDISRRKTDVGKLDAWLQELEDRKDLYDRADGIVVKLGNLGELDHDIADLQTKLQEESARTEMLKKSESDTQKALDAAQKNLKDKDDEINRLHKEQDDLDSAGTNRELNSVLPEKVSRLEKLKTAIADRDALNGERAELLVSITTDEKTLAAMEDEVVSVQKIRTATKRTYDTAQRCYDTMNMSTDDILVDLRKKLQEEHQSVCPLCGQEIKAFTDDYAARVTELDGIRAERQAEFERADREWNDAKEERDRFSGQLEQKKKNKERLDKDINAKDGEIKKMAEEAGLNPEEELSVRIEAALSDLEARKSELETRQGRISALGEKLKALSEERKPLEQTRDDAKEKWQEASAAVRKNEEDIREYGRQKAESEKKRDSLQKELSVAITPFYPDWPSDLEQAAVTLKADAREYREMVRAAGDAHAAIDRSKRIISTLEGCRDSILGLFPEWKKTMAPASHASADIVKEWTTLNSDVSSAHTAIEEHEEDIAVYKEVLDSWYLSTGRDEAALDAIQALEPKLQAIRVLVKDAEDQYRDACNDNSKAQTEKEDAMKGLGIAEESDIPALQDLEAAKTALNAEHDGIVSRKATLEGQLKENEENQGKLDEKEKDLNEAEAVFNKWEPINRHFGGYRFRTLVQTYILRPLLNNANIYLKEITDRYKLTCSEDNEQLAILVQDRYNKDQIRSATVLSGGERFMISLALSLALSSLNRPDLNVNILFIDEGFGTLDKASLESVMVTLEKLQEIAGESNRRVGIISHREELDERIPTQIHVVKKGEGRSKIQFVIGCTPV
jgi:DNA repair exonuclease SbcCD ATPase subunit